MPFESLFRESRASAVRASRTQVKEGFTIHDYELQRPAEATPKGWDDIFRICNQWYYLNGIVRTIIDLMADFCVAGIQVSSPIATQQAVLRKWASKITGGSETKGIYFISENIVNMLYRLGNVGVHKLYATKTIRQQEEWKRALSKFKVETEIPEDFYSPKVIPAHYATINPRQIEAPPPEISAFLGQNIYYLKMPKNGINDLGDWSHKEQVSRYIDLLPSDIKKMLKEGMPTKLDNDRFKMLHYKKDDDQMFAFPLLYSALDALYDYNKLRMVDRMAADNCCDRVVFVKMGDAKQSIIPRPSEINHIIKGSGRGGSKSYVVVPPYISLESDDSNAVAVFGDKKYIAVLQAIYTTFGVPQALTGNSQGAAANNYMQMKVLVKKLEYGRRLITDFWTNELNQVCYAFGFKPSFHITFANQELGDEASMKKLMEGLYDRRLVSDETMREQMNLIPQVEDWRIKKEDKMRKSRKKPPVYTPLINGNFENEAKKIALQSGTYALEEIGVNTISDADLLRVNKIEYSTNQSIRLAKESSKIKQSEIVKQDTNIQTQDTILAPITTTETPKENGRPRQSKDQIKRKEKTPGTMKKK